MFTECEKQELIDSPSKGHFGRVWRGRARSQTIVFRGEPEKEKVGLKVKIMAEQTMRES